MIELGVREKGDLRTELEQGAIRFVGLDDDPFPRAPSRIGIRVAELAPEDIGRVQPAPAQRVDDHARRRRLAVGSGDGQAALELSDLRQQIGPVKLPAAAA